MNTFGKAEMQKKTYRDQLVRNAENPPNAVFVKSASGVAGFPEGSLPEFCLLGRSNVGKSSFINHAFGRKNLAKVSKTPGKTALANFFSVENTMTWVDLPGYGYARKSHDENRRLGNLIDEYCRQRTNLNGAILLLDIRHPGLDHDYAAVEWLSENKIPFLPVLTKVDKLSKNIGAKHARLYKRMLAEPPFIVTYSTREIRYRELFWKIFSDWASRYIPASSRS